MLLKPLLPAAGTCFALVVVAAVRVAAESSQQPPSTIFDGVFSAEQSARGEAQYRETCKRCHKDDLSGDPSEEIPPLVGDKFLAEWAGWTVGDLFEFSMAKMPPKKKDRLKLSGQIYADVIAYILERNGFPAGNAELMPALEPLFEIEMSRSE
jgi:cytochrome c